MARRCVLAVHAHPDDESSKGAATLARYAHEGVRTVLVTCTGGEAGEVVDPGVAHEVAELGLMRVRSNELALASRLLGYERVHLLGYADSGMDGETEGCFAKADVDEVIARLVDIFRSERPDVVVGYDERYAANHPDHRVCHRATVAAFAAAATAGWRPTKLYLTRTHSPSKARAMHGWLTDQHRPSPYGTLVSGAPADPTTTRIDVREQIEVARAALRAHRSQVAPDDPWFFAVPAEVMAELYPWEDFELAASTVASVVDADGYEHDFFAGLPPLG